MVRAVERVEDASGDLARECKTEQHEAGEKGRADLTGAAGDPNERHEGEREQRHVDRKPDSIRVRKAQRIEAAPHPLVQRGDVVDREEREDHADGRKSTRPKRLREGEREGGRRGGCDRAQPCQCIAVDVGVQMPVAPVEREVVDEVGGSDESGEETCERRARQKDPTRVLGPSQ
jgi:hypothetical protein